MLSTTASAVWRSSRPPFLILTPACIALGAASTAVAGNTFSSIDLIIALLGGLSAHISVNTFNEFFDFDSGLDNLTQRTPFSGGSGSLPDLPQAKYWVWACAWVTLLISLASGVYFLSNTGPAIVPLGLIGLVIIYAYTLWINKNPWACLIAPGLGFGPLMVIGTEAALTGNISAVTCLASLVPFFLINNLLLLNQLPDIDADRQIGRRHLAIVYGTNATARMYLAFSLAAAISVLIGIIGGMLPLLSAITLVPMALAVKIFKGVQEHACDTPRLIPSLGLNVVVAISTPALLALSLAI